jgi:hypothetical protein
LIASKFLHDDGEEDEVINKEWAKSGRISVSQINKLERDFLAAIVSDAQCYFFLIIKCRANIFMFVFFGTLFFITRLFLYYLFI